MSDFDLTFGLNDRAPVITATLTTADGTPVSLAGATVVFLYRVSTLKDDQQAVACTITDATNGVVQFTFPGAAAGTYRAQFKATLASGLLIHFPNNRLLSMHVMEEP